jgi:hypothetical protein
VYIGVLFDSETSRQWGQEVAREPRPPAVSLVEDDVDASRNSSQTGFGWKPSPPIPALAPEFATSRVGCFVNGKATSSEKASIAQLSM